MRDLSLGKIAEGEMESEHPGYLGFQDTSYVGTLRGVGRVCQQTFIDALPLAKEKMAGYDLAVNG